MNTSSDSKIAMMKKADKASHGADRLSAPSNSNSPSDGEPGGRPQA